MSCLKFTDNCCKYSCWTAFRKTDPDLSVSALIVNSPFTQPFSSEVMLKCCTAVLQVVIININVGNLTHCYHFTTSKYNNN